MTKVNEFCLFYFYKKDGLPGRSQRRRPEQSDTTTLDTLVTLAHFRHSYLLRQSQLSLTTHKVRGFKKGINITQDSLTT